MDIGATNLSNSLHTLSSAALFKLVSADEDKGGLSGESAPCCFATSW